MAELADALVLGSSVHDVQVRFLLSAPFAAGVVLPAANFCLLQKVLLFCQPSARSLFGVSLKRKRALFVCKDCKKGN